jgi:hypothetical protein
MLILYKNANDAASKANWVMDSLKEGWPNSEYAAYTQTYYGQPAAYWGFINSNKNNILRHIDNGVDWWFWDMPFWGRWSRHSDEEHYWHAAKNNIYPTQVKDFPNDRFNKAIKPYRSGSFILVCPSSDTVTRWLTGKSMHEWVTETVLEIKNHSDRPIHVRYKPRVNGMSGPDAEVLTGIGTVKMALEDCHCVVTTASLVAVTAQLEGVPTFCDPHSFATDVSETELNRIETPLYADRERWFNWLSYNQFTEREIRSGFAYDVLTEMYQ